MKFKVGQTVYFPTIRGEIIEKKVVEAKGVTPLEGCDMLISDDRDIYSASSERYFATKKEAAIKGFEEQQGLIETHQSIVDNHRKAKDKFANIIINEC